MSRPLVLYKPTWLDKFFRREFQALNQAERAQCLQLLEGLMLDLRECRHPIKDPQLGRWRPSPYRGVVKVKGGHLAEYRLTSTMRVIACYFEDREDILLVVATIKHDHERMKRLLKEHGRAFLSYSEDPGVEDPGADNPG